MESFSMWNHPVSFPFNCSSYGTPLLPIHLAPSPGPQALSILSRPRGLYIHSSGFRHVPDSHGFSRLGRAGSRYYRYFSQTPEVELAVYLPPFRPLYPPRILYAFVFLCCFLMLSEVTSLGCLLLTALYTIYNNDTRTY